MNASDHTFNPEAEEQAALWAARLDGSELTAAQLAELETWLAENPAHRTLLSQYTQLSADLEEHFPALLEASAAHAEQAEQAGRTRAVEESETAPEVVVPLRTLWNPRRAAGWALAAAAVVAGFVWLARPRHQSEAFVTAAAERRSVTLADGSQVELNARTRLQVDIGGAERHVRLAGGEAFFTVSKDPKRPFMIETPAGSVRVTGTVFGVHSEAASDLAVTVVEGSVLVRPDVAPAAPVSLHAGDRLIAGTSVAVQKLSADELRDALAWRKGQIVFDHVPLREALARFAHYQGREGDFTVTAAAAELQVSGLYSLDDVDGFLAGIEQSLRVKAAHERGTGIRVDLAEPR
jgi:transmembrane sensor